jgi:hypothetical protein|tara:strand:- start:603 stop:884 length:282 start_codon:yes stop_codon:yes gene_type:complete
MDIHCRFCGEPWDHEELHDQYKPVRGAKYMEELIPYDTMVKYFKKYGCGAWLDYPNTKRKVCNQGTVDSEKAWKSAVLQDLSPYPDDWIADMD